MNEGYVVKKAQRYFTFVIMQETPDADAASVVEYRTKYNSLL